MITLRSLVFVVWLYGSMLLVALVLAPIALFHRYGVLLATRAWGLLTLFGLRWIVGARVVVEGREFVPKGAALVASKHQSMLETLIISYLINDPAIVFKEELLQYPVFGWYIGRGDMVPIARDEGASALKGMLRAAKRAIENKRQVFIYPEGTRKVPGAPPDYKPGVAGIYLSLKLPCTPIALNTGTIWPRSGFKRYPGVATVRVLPPIPAGLPRDEFMRQLETRIESACAELEGRAPAAAKETA